MKTDKLSIISGVLVGGIALIAFILSFDAIMHLAINNGVNPYLAWMVPLIIDGAMIVFSVSVMRATLANEGTRAGWLLIVAFTAVSVWFNIAHSNQQLYGMVIAALAPIALFTTFETLMKQIRNTVQGGVNALAKHWRERAMVLMGIAKRWRERANSLEWELSSLTAEHDALQSRADNLQEKANEAGDLRKENGRLQKEIDQLSKKIEQLQDVDAAWQHMNEKAKAAAMYNAGQIANLEDAASMANVSASTVSRMAGQLNGVAKVER